VSACVCVCVVCAQWLTVGTAGASAGSRRRQHQAWHVAAGCVVLQETADHTTGIVTHITLVTQSHLSVAILRLSASSTSGADPASILTCEAV
jgi:hypothetical protein